MVLMHNSFCSKIMSLESNLLSQTETRLTAVEDNVDRIKSDLDTVRKDIDKKLAELSNEAKSGQALNNTGLEMNIVIHRIHESDGENVTNKVNGLIKDGLKLRSVTVEKADRKVSRRQGAPGVIVVKCRSVADKKSIMDKKKSLKYSANYDRVFIDHDKPYHQRLQEDNLRTIASAVDGNKLSVRGGRLVKPNNRRQPAT